MINKLKEHKFSILYLLSFLVYPMIICLDLIYLIGDYPCIALAILLGIYELMYIIFIGRKENVRLGRRISTGVLYALISLNILPIWSLVDDFINGYQDYAFLSGPIGECYYGFEAIINDDVMLFIFGITFTVFIVYLSAYLVISRIIKNKKKK